MLTFINLIKRLANELREIILCTDKGGVQAKYALRNL